MATQVTMTAEPGKTQSHQPCVWKVWPLRIRSPQEIAPASDRPR